jgi:hypothetical protein
VVRLPVTFLGLLLDLWDVGTKDHRWQTSFLESPREIFTAEPGSTIDAYDAKLTKQAQGMPLRERLAALLPFGTSCPRAG